jgi:hypothetical protein
MMRAVSVIRRAQTENTSPLSSALRSESPSDVGRKLEEPELSTYPGGDFPTGTVPALEWLSKRYPTAFSSSLAVIALIG